MANETSLTPEQAATMKAQLLKYDYEQALVAYTDRVATLKKLIDLVSSDEYKLVSIATDEALSDLPLMSIDNNMTMTVRTLRNTLDNLSNIASRLTPTPPVDPEADTGDESPSE